MSERTTGSAASATGVGALVASCALALVIGGVAGLLSTFTHAQLPPWGLVAGLAIAASLALGFRLVFDSRVVGTAAAVGFVVGSVLLTLPASGAPMFALDGPIGWIWALGPALLGVAAVAPPWPGGAARRP